MLLLSSRFSDLEHAFGFNLRFETGECVGYQNVHDFILPK